MIVSPNIGQREGRCPRMQTRAVDARSVPDGRVLMTQRFAGSGPRMPRTGIHPMFSPTACLVPLAAPGPRE